MFDAKSKDSLEIYFILWNNKRTPKGHDVVFEQSYLTRDKSRMQIRRILPHLTFNEL